MLSSKFSFPIVMVSQAFDLIAMLYCVDGGMHNNLSLDSMIK